MFVRVRNFGASVAGDFAPNGIGHQLFSTVAAVVGEIEAQASFKASGIGSARQGTITRAQARADLRDTLEAINRTARAMADVVPGLENKFRVPRNANDQQLLASARSFAADVVPFSADFTAHELPADLVANLNSDIAAMEAAIDSQSNAVGDHIAARAALDDAIGRGVDAVRKLGAIIKNKYGEQVAKLAEWTSVSHTERARRRTSPTPSETAVGPTPPGP
jgi:hypothetical protein